MYSIFWCPFAITPSIILDNVVEIIVIIVFFNNHLVRHVLKVIPLQSLLFIPKQLSVGFSVTSIRGRLGTDNLDAMLSSLLTFPSDDVVEKRNEKGRNFVHSVALVVRFKSTLPGCTKRNALWYFLFNMLI